MEHRLGCRVETPIHIRFTAVNSLLANIGQVTNLSLSGAFIAGFQFRVLARIDVILELEQRATIESIPAYVARICAKGIGVEWCQFAPRPIVGLLRALETSSKARSLELSSNRAHLSRRAR
jgi:hypothetical protein